MHQSKNQKPQINLEHSKLIGRQIWLWIIDVAGQCHVEDGPKSSRLTNYLNIPMPHIDQTRQLTKGIHSHIVKESIVWKVKSKSPHMKSQRGYSNIHAWKCFNKLW